MTFAHGTVSVVILWVIAALLFCVLLVLRKRATALCSFLRFFALSCLIIALFEPFFEKKTEFSHALLLLDVSESMNEDAAQALLSKINSMQSQGLQLEVLPFAAKPALSSFSGASLDSFRKLKDHWSSLNIGETNLETTEPHEDIPAGMKVLLLSDGFQSKGNVQAAIPTLRQKDIKIFPFFPSTIESSSQSIHIAQMYAPLVAPLNKSVDIRVGVENSSSKNESGTLEIVHDGQKLLSKKIEVTAEKEGLFIAQSDPSKEGIKEVTATFKPDNPSIPTSSETIYLSGELREKVLLINGAADDSRNLDSALSQEAFQLKSITDAEAKNLPDLSNYAVVIFNNISKGQLSDSAPQLVEKYVRSGGGFIMIGGNRSFGLGDYKDTPIETILPVKLLPPQSKQKRLNIAVELVLDKSKSMNENNKIEFVKDASRNVVRNLKDDDFIGLTAFDTEPFEVLPLVQVGPNREAALERISIIFARGKTNLLPALNIARGRLESAHAGRKHIIVLTDGDLPDPGPHYVEFVRQMRFSGITTTAIVIGPVTDNTLDKMAEVGGGTYYQTTDFQALPKLFLQDIKVRSGEETMKEQQEFEVRKGPGTLSSTDIRAYPVLLGFVTTQPKDNANLELLAYGGTETSPLLASWNYEKGRSIAFTSDANGRWSRTWVEWPRFREFWSQLIKAARPSLKDNQENLKFDLRYYMEGASLIIDLTLLADIPSSKIAADLLLPDGKTKTIEFSSPARGKYRSEIQNPLPGKYEFRGLVNERKLTPVAFHLSGELFGEKKGKYDIPLLEQLASATGGKVNPSLEQVRANKTEKVERKDLTLIFLLAAICLLAIEIFVREIWRGRLPLQRKIGELGGI